LGRLAGFVMLKQSAGFRQREQAAIDFELAGVVRHRNDVADGVAFAAESLDDEVSIDKVLHGEAESFQRVRWSANQCDRILTHVVCRRRERIRILRRPG